LAKENRIATDNEEAHREHQHYMRNTKKSDITMILEMIGGLLLNLKKSAESMNFMMDAYKALYGGALI